MDDRENHELYFRTRKMVKYSDTIMLSPKYSDRLTIIEGLVRLVSLDGYTEILALIFLKNY